MRRPSRSIEVFDISLMAVVTKAMGAFLVLMLVFMQYYSSGPIGQKTAADILQSIDDTEKDLAQASTKLSEHASPEEIAKLLDEARRRLAEARQEIEQLKRENDALNSQVARLEGENAQLEKQIQDLQRKIDEGKTIISSDLINWDCLDVRLQIGLVSVGMFLERENGAIKDPYVLNVGGLGSSDSTDDGYTLKADPKAVRDAPGQNFRFNNSAFRYAANDGSYSIIVTKQSINPKTIRGTSIRPLKKSKQDCTIFVSVQHTSPAKEELINEYTRKFTLPKEDYSTVLYYVKMDHGKYGLLDSSPEIKTWLADQIAHAEKEP
jgi:cell division septum initiation protein DivIVA